MANHELHVYSSIDAHDHPRFDQNIKWWGLDAPDEGFVISVESDGVILGVSSVLFRPVDLNENAARIAHFGHHYVDPSIRQQGFFAQMLNLSEKLAADNNVSSVFVTPNSQSETIYKAQGYQFHESLHSHLYLINLNVESSTNTVGKINNISAENYFNKTRGYQRFHQLDELRFNWRFNQPNTRYIYLSSTDKNDDIHLAFRKGKNGPIDVYVLTEVFLNGIKPNLNKISTLVRCFLLSVGVDASSKVITQSFSSPEDNPDIEMYRRFPFALKFLNASIQNITNQLQHYQFSDSDFG